MFLYVKIANQYIREIHILQEPSQMRETIDKGFQEPMRSEINGFS